MEVRLLKSPIKHHIQSGSCCFICLSASHRINIFFPLCLFPISATSCLSLISISVILLMTAGCCNSVWTLMLFANSHWDSASWMSISSGFFEFPLASGLSLATGGTVSPDKAIDYLNHPYIASRLSSTTSFSIKTPWSNCLPLTKASCLSSIKWFMTLLSLFDRTFANFIYQVCLDVWRA